MTAESDNKMASHIQREASKGKDAVLEAVEQRHQELMEGIAGFSPEQVSWKPGPDEWSVLEIIQHVVAGNRGGARLCAAQARGEVLEGSEGDPDTVRSFWESMANGPYTTVAEARTDLADAYAEMTEFVRSVSPESNMDRSRGHPLVGPMNCLEWAVFQCLHDGDHVSQIAATKASEALPS